MAKFHFNPTNGDAGACRAEISCPFGIPLDGHFNSLREAAAAGEQQMKESMGGSFDSGMIDSFEDWQVKQQKKMTQDAEFIEEAKASFVEPTINVQEYRNAMPPGLENMGDYAHTLGLDLQELNYFSSSLSKSHPVTRAHLQQMLLESIKLHVLDASDKNENLDKTLNESVFFKDPTISFKKDRVVVEAHVFSGDDELITSVDNKGQASFHVYDMIEGDSYDPNRGRVATPLAQSWMNSFKDYQDHLYLRVLWAQEEKRRQSRYEEIGRRALKL